MLIDHKDIAVQTVGIVHQFKWEVPSSIFDALNKGKMPSSGKWICPVREKSKDEDALSAVFVAQLFSDGVANEVDDNKEEEQNDAARNVGFSWQLHGDNKFQESLMVSVDIRCSELKFSVQIFDVLMSMKDTVKAGVRRSGHRALFPLSKLEDFDDQSFIWRVSIKAYAFKND